jgi:hypothetical protein
MDWNARELRVMKSPAAKGSAEQWVRQEFVSELKAYRQRRQRAASAMVVMIDADMRSIQDRINELDAECTTASIPFRADDEAVAIAVPRRNIETWINYLNEQPVDELSEYPRLGRASDCGPAVARLVRLCRSTGLKTDAPPALAAACREYNDRIKNARST